MTLRGLPLVLQASIVMNHNREAWAMPGDLEEYLKLYDEADRVARQLHLALSDLSVKLAQVRQLPRLLLQPESGKWPTQEELRALCQTMDTKAAPLQAKYNALSEEQWKIVPHPLTIGRR